MPTSPCRYPLARTGSADTAGLLMIKKIFKAIKNILFPKIYMPWEDPINGSNLTHDERVEMIALIDNILADLDEEG